MAENPIKTPLPADLPEDWTGGQTVAPTGAEVGLSEQHGYNYLMEQVNAAQTAAKEIGSATTAVLLSRSSPTARSSRIRPNTNTTFWQAVCVSWPS